MIVVVSLFPFLGLLSCVGTHVLISRARSRILGPQSLIASALVGVAVVVGMALIVVAGDGVASLAADRWGIVAVWILTYLCLVYCYVLGFYLLGETARRVRLLIELDGAGERGMTIDEILRVYNARMIVEVRLQRLIAGGQIVEQGSRYVVGRPLMLYAAKAVVLLKLLLLGANSEFASRSGNAENRNSATVTARPGSGQTVRRR